MYQSVKLSDSIFYVGVNDRRTELFENMWPLPRGVAYNSYIIRDEKVALIDTVEIGQVEKFLKKVRSVLGDQPVDYLVINHMEPDHAGSVNIIRQWYPDIKIVGNKKTLPMVEGFFEITDNLIEVGEGDEIDLGSHKLQFYMAPMVHWPETMVTYEHSRKVLFSGDAFGSFGTLDGGIFDDEMDFSYFHDEMRRYYSNIVGKYGSPVQKVLQKLQNLDIKIIASTHGPIIRSHIDEVLQMYNEWSRFQTQEGVVVAFASMYGHTEEMAEVTARAIAEEGIRDIRMYDVSKTHSSYIISDIFKYKAVVLGSSTYASELHPNMEALVNKLKHIGVRDHYLGVLGSFTWAGTAAKHLKEFGEALKWEIIDEPVEEKHTLKKQKYDECRTLGQSIAEKLKAERN